MTKRVLAVDEPLSTKPGSKDKRYRVAVSYLRFWLAFLGPHLGEIERGRGDRVLARIGASWTSWRGRAIEPIIREALERLAPPVLMGEDNAPGIVGGYWTRTNNPEIDIVLGDRSPVAGHIIALPVCRSAEALRESDQDVLRPADVAELVRVLVPDYLVADESHTVLGEPRERGLDVVHLEHHAKVAQSVDGGGAVVLDGLRFQEAGELDAAVAVRRAQHGDLDALIAEAGAATGPLSLHPGPAFELQPEVLEELDHRGQVLHDDAADELIGVGAPPASSAQARAQVTKIRGRDTTTAPEARTSHDG